MNASEPATQDAPLQWTTNYTLVETLGLMTLSLGIALIVIAVGYRMIKTMAVLRKYDSAVDKMRGIETRVVELEGQLISAEHQYQRDLAELGRRHAGEVFDLQQQVFERNSDITDLRIKLLQMSKNTPI
jgi:hypothetical protein